MAYFSLLLITSAKSCAFVVEQKSPAPNTANPMNAQFVVRHYAARSMIAQPVVHD